MSAFSDIFGGGLFGDLFGQRRRGPRAGQDLLFKLEIDLVEAARGATKPIDVPRERGKKDAAAQLTSLLERQVQALLDELNASIV